jgi:hypothetical protein
VRQILTSYTIIQYRLASKQFCAIGAEELFHTLIIQHSTRSLERLEAIASTDHLRKHVKTICWDTNLWKIQHVDDLHEWENYFIKKAAYYQTPKNFQKSDPSALDSVLATHYTCLANNRDEWDAYLDKASDERTARKSFQPAVFAKFQNMQTIHICNGTLITEASTKSMIVCTVHLSSLHCEEERASMTGTAILVLSTSSPFNRYPSSRGMSCTWTGYISLCSEILLKATSAN